MIHMGDVSHDLTGTDSLPKSTFSARLGSLPRSPVANSAGSIMASGNQIFNITGLFPLHQIVPVDINQSEINASQSQFLLTYGSFQLLFGSQQFSFVHFQLGDFPTGHQQPFTQFTRRYDRLHHKCIVHFSVSSDIPLFRLIRYSGPDKILIYLPVLLPPFFTKDIDIGEADGIFAADARL